LAPIEGCQLACALLNGARSALMIDALRAFSAGKTRGRPKFFPLTNSIRTLINFARALHAKFLSVCID
jgi:hypothetical protein